MTIEEELLSIGKTLKEFWMILLGQCINAFTAHKNLTCTNFNTNHVYFWCLLLEEFKPMIHYIPSSKNEAANTLS